MNKPKLLFVYDLKNEEKWMDGLWAALNLLEEDFEIKKHNFNDSILATNLPYDIILGWGGFNSRVDKVLQMPLYKGYRKALLIGGNSYPAEGMENYDVLFYETKWVRDFLNLKYHSNIVHAFGVNIDIYDKVDLPTPIIWDYIGVGSFAEWKRWEKMKDKKGNRLVIGEYQVDNKTESGSIALDLIKDGVMVSNMVNPYDLSVLYNYSRTLYMPSSIYGGGERAVLEARACGINVEIEDDNPKLKELLESPIYDHVYYAKQLKKGILSCL